MKIPSVRRSVLVFAAATVATTAPMAGAQELEKTREQRQELREERREDRLERRAARLSAQQQRRLIAEQQARNRAYKTYLQRQELAAQRRATQLERARRLAQYQYQQRYLQRLRDQRLALAQYDRYDYDNDPYFYTAPTYRYTRAGRVYQTNQYGADLLRRAVNYGYEEGVRAGQADRQDGLRANYRDSFAYRDASLGYTGMYVSQADYTHYFREGFRRGYEDGYMGQSRYGTSANGTFNLLSTVLGTILNLQDLY
jgi:hypothetical protein